MEIENPPVITLSKYGSALLVDMNEWGYVEDEDYELIDYIGSLGATTCITVLIKCKETKRSGVTHIGGGLEKKVLRELFLSVGGREGGSTIHYSVLGAYDQSPHALENQRLFHEFLKEIEEDCSCHCINDFAFANCPLNADGHPCFTACGMDREGSFVFFNDSISPIYLLPLYPFRLFATSHQEVKPIFSPENFKLEQREIHFSISCELPAPPSFIHQILTLSDERLLSVFSTSPSCEPSWFAATIRARYIWLYLHHQIHPELHQKVHQKTLVIKRSAEDSSFLPWDLHGFPVL